MGDKDGKSQGPEIVEGALQVREGSRFTIVASRFNNFIVDRLLEGALDALTRHGARASLIRVIRVPGSWELPLVAAREVKRGGVDAVVALGAVIRGGTVHFEYIAAEVSKGLAQVALQSGVPVVFGVITADTVEQAIERAGTKAGNKGVDAAVAAIELVNLLDQLG